MTRKYYFLILILGSLFSCKERIDIALAEDADKLIIEGEVHDGAGPYYVKLSRSTKFGNSTTFLPHSPSSVFISDNEGNKDSLIKHADGIYKTTAIQGKVGNTYFLTVNDMSGVYTAQSKLNSSPEIDSFYFFLFLTAENLNPTIVINEPINEENYYRYFARKNGKTPEFNYVSDDKLINGSKWRFSAFREDWKKGDSGEFVFLGIDKANFNYWNILVQNQAAVSGGNESAAPTNPPTNISGGEVLGYFSAHSRKTKKFIVP
jgi:hypothetical protein